jgi:phosphatidylethanolamine/phosphatidyl-N-methylethanolamine N-methyltransferase
VTASPVPETATIIGALAEMKKVRQQYQNIARYYDTAYRPFLAHGSRILLGVRPLHRHERVLEVGVGTGFTLPHYPEQQEVTAIDLCPEMIAVASRKRLGQARARVRLLAMDAHDLAFADRSFDVILFPHSFGLMEDPGRVLAEVARVARNGAELRILHTFEWQNPALRKVETALYDAFENRLGWGRPLNLERVLKLAHKHGFEEAARRKLGWKTILVFRRAA